jgi:cell division protein FtsB
VAISSSFIGDGGVTVIYQQSRYKKLLAAKIQEEEARRESLLARIEGLKNDPLEVERMAREELGLVRESELVFDFREAGPR